jgi:hypothetical protein
VIRRAAILAAACLAALPQAALAGGSSAPQYITFMGSPPPARHSPRPAMDDQTRADLKLPALLPLGAAQPAAAGRLAPGEAFLTIGVRHGVTGVLASDVSAKGWFGKKRRLAAGSSVFGIPMGGPDGRAFVWCAPQQGQVKDQPKAWAVTCLPFGDKANLWVEGKPAMMPVTLDWDDANIRETDIPDVRRQPVSLPPLTLSYAFAGWDAKGWLKLEYRLDWGDGPQVLRAIALAPGADGAVAVKLMGGQFALRPDPNAAAGATLQVAAPPKPDAPVEF